MIASVRGTLRRVDGERAVIEVGGFGVEVLASGRTLGSLSGRLGEEVGLQTYLHVREDALQLFGFTSARERTFFLWLIGVSGVGPKVALAVLSGYPVEVRTETVPGQLSGVAQMAWKHARNHHFVQISEKLTPPR